MNTEEFCIEFQKIFGQYRSKRMKRCQGGKIETKKRRVFSEISKLDENYQYGFESLPIGVFKKELSVSMNMWNKSIKSINPNAKLAQFL